MKKMSLLLFASVLIFACEKKETNEVASLVSINQTKQKQLKRYGVSSGIITYESKISGKVMGSVISGSGTEKMYFKDWGAIELIDETSTQTTTMKMFGKKNEDVTSTHNMTKLDNGESAVVDFKTKEIYLNRDLAMDLTKMFHTDADAGDVGKTMAEGMGGKIVGKEIFLGYPCEIMELMGSKQWIYKGVTLKLEMTTMGITTIKKATSAKFDINVADKYFKLPDFPVIKQESYMSNQEFDEDYDDMSDEIEALKKMSFDEWKEIAKKEDEEFRNMSDKELRETYDMMQTMLKLQN
jgi:hypothetical protein